VIAERARLDAAGLDSRIALEFLTIHDRGKGARA
jgi:hypothetical protein